MAFLIGGANSLTGGYEISNSLRFDGDSYQSRDPSETGITIKGNFSAWVKFATSNTEVALFGGFDSSGANDNDGYMVFKRTADGNLQFEGGDNVYLETTALFRDTSAWYHIVLAIDSSNATANNKQRIYVNGAEITAFDTRNNLTNLQDLPMNSTAGNDDRFLVGCDEDTGGRGLFFTGYMADVYWIDNNSQMAASDFGEYNDNGVWIPKDGSDISFGDKNSFKMEYGSSGNLGLDSSGLGNSLGDNAGLAATNQTTDTPTNNFCTMNPLDVGSDLRDNGSFAEGNLEVTNGATSGQADQQRVRGTIAVTKGKWYFEMKQIANSASIGVLATEAAHGGTSANSMLVEYNDGGEIRFFNGSGRTTKTTGIDSFDDDDIVGCALDMDNRRAYFHKNGAYQGDPTPDPAGSPSGAGQFGGIQTGFTMAPCMFDNSSGSAGKGSFNFGNAPFAISSGNSDGAGFGNFEYAVPSGYFSLCTKNLATYG